MKEILICALLWLATLPLAAAPAYPKKTKVEVSPGVWVEVYLKGDENCKFAETTDGYTLIPDSLGWIYADTGTDGFAVASSHRLVPYDRESAAVRQFKKETTPRIPVRQSRKAEARQGAKSLVGHFRSLVILMEFKDKKFSLPKADFERLFNEIGYSEDKAIGSVRDFYLEASNGQLDFKSDIFGPFTTVNNMEYYGGNTEYSHDKNPLAMAVEAIRKLPADLDLSQYDIDGDGYVDNVHIIYAGYGEEAGASTNAIWAHEYPQVLPPRVNGYRFKSYSCSPELRSNRGKGITRIGVVCHELGHALGANDFYDTDYETGGSFSGTGIWDIMASGSWNNDGISPPHFNPYVKAYDFGWIDAPVITESGDYELAPDEVVRIETGSNGDYYLLEYRSQTGFNAALPSAGLMIYHHHPNFDKKSLTNNLNSTHPQCFYPVCASTMSATPLLKKDYGDINSSGCPFPFSNRSSFSASTTPAAFAWNKSEIKWQISSISKNAEGNMTFSFSGEGNGTGDEEPDTVATNVVYKESFEKGLADFELTQMWGNVNWRVYPSFGVFYDSEKIPSPFDGKKQLVLFNGTKSSQIEASISSSVIKIDEAVKNELTLEYQLKVFGSAKQKLKVSVTNIATDEIVKMEAADTTSGWTKVSIPLPIGWSEISYSIEGKVNSGGLFIDDVKIITTFPLSSISSPKASKENNSVYTLNGLMVAGSDDSFLLSNLPSGIYILCGKNGERKKVFVK